MLAPPADLSVIKSAGSDAVTAGRPLTYTLSVSNAGPGTADDVTVTDELPPGVGFESVAGIAWTCDETDGSVTALDPA